ncbi:MAG TPA: peptide ABC transporter substrate-binding protein, partial [Chloroflexia bacterium]|nr:peptide ABC transporter substrate-binding protein [Chloroflexia bacterium]
MKRSTTGPGNLLPPGRAFCLLALLVPLLASARSTSHATGFHTPPGQPAQQTRALGPSNISVSGRFLEVWSAPGSQEASVYVNGWPITPRRPEIALEDGKVYDTQWFERARYEAHPQNGPPYDVLLGRLGARLVEGRGRIDPATKRARNPEDQPFLAIDARAEADGRTRLWFPESGHTISGKFLDNWRRYGGLGQFGFPLSEPFQETSPTDGKTYTVQYFERARFELHPDAPAPYDVELGLLGVQQHLLTPIPAEQLPIAPPPGVTSAKDTLYIGSLQEPTTLVGFEESTTVAARFLDAITFGDRLVHADDKQNYFPLAAWYVPTFENGGSFFVGTGGDRHLVTKYKLRPGIKWSDGVELTSNDAIFAYKLLVDDPNVVMNEQVLKLQSVDNPDRYTVVYNWMSANQATAKFNDPATDKKAYAFLKLYVDSNAPVVDTAYFLVGTVLPEHVLNKLPVDKLGESTYALNPVGYGPYKVQLWEQGQEMVLVRNEHYNLTEKPLIKTIVSTFQTDVNQNVSQFVLGDLDAIAGEAFTVPPELCPQIAQAGGVCASMPGPTWEHLEFSFIYEPFQDKRVRQAIMQAINREQIHNVVFGGAARVSNGPTPASVYFSLENPNFALEFPNLAAKYALPRYPYDPAAANRLLDEAGWAAGPDGTRAKGGVKLSFQFASTRNVARQVVQALVQADLKAVGVNAAIMNVRQSDFLQLPSSFILLATGKAQMILVAISQDALTDFRSFSTDELWTPQSQGVNFQQYKNSKVTEANRVFNLETERTKVAEAAAIAQMEIMSDLPVVPLVERPNIEIYRTTLQNRRLSNSTVSQWWNITQWYF